MVFVIDTSDSMSMERRLAAAKGAVMALLVTAQVTGDRVALVTFEGDRAEVALPPTASLARARARLQRLPTGGATPLADGLARALAIVRAERRRTPTVHPYLVLSSDGEANVPRHAGADIESEILALADEIRREDVRALVLDSNPPFSPSESLRTLSRRLGGRYERVRSMDANAIVHALFRGRQG